MDLILAETFLAVASTGSLSRAAERLHVTQAAVSARLQTLEEELEKSLFIRNKAGARLTPAGQAWLPFAAQLLQVWEQAKLKVAAQASDAPLLRIGGEVSLWSAVLLNWLIALRRSQQSATLRTQVDTVSRLLDQVQSGALDLAVVYAPHKRPGVEMVALLEEELILVSTDCRRRSLELADYVLVDWGPDFRAQHDQAYPDLRASQTSIALGPLALRYVLAVGGTGYFRARAAAPYLESGELSVIPDAPVFSYAVHAAISRRADPSVIDWALPQLRGALEQPNDEWV